MPISYDSEDKIGIHQQALELKDAINQGAQTIAVTSDFGGGKSSLVKHLETLYSKVTTKFCYVNLWCDLEHEESEANLIEIHKSFIYQLASQIGKSKGQYVSKRLSENYGLVKLTLQSRWLSIISYIMFAFVIVGLLSMPLFEGVTSKVIKYSYFVEHHDEIGISAIVIAILLGLLILYKADIVFSSKQSENGRKIDEHELMDIYKSYICSWHFRHYIVVIEDLDRSSCDDAEKFIKELRRYYVPTKRFWFKAKCINTLLKKIGLFNRNRITFVVNIKEEASLNLGSHGLYAKVFDYVLNLKTINIDNYDVLLRKLLADNKAFFKQYNIPAFNNDEMIPEFEWLKRGDDIDIRELKNRLNATISTYISLSSKFDRNSISLQKCIAAAYITLRFTEEYRKVKKIGFDKIIDLYVTNPSLTDEDIINCYSDSNVTVGEDFAQELLRLIKYNMIDSDYRQYFYNYPKESYLHNNDESALINIILYDSDVTKNLDFDNLVLSVIKSNANSITTAFNRLKNLGALCPKCIFYSSNLLEFALNKFPDMVWKTFEEELSYDDESISQTSKILIPVIKESFINDKERINKLCEIIIGQGTAHAIISLRRSLIEAFHSDIIKFKQLYSSECPLITKVEVMELKNVIEVLNLIDFDSSELGIDLAETIHKVILSEFSFLNEYEANLITQYYVKIYDALGETENEILTKQIFEISVKNKKIVRELESIVVLNNDFSTIEEQYRKLVCLVAENQDLPISTLSIIDDNKMCSKMSKSVCEQLLSNGYFESFLANACAVDIGMVDFNDSNIIKTINSIDFYDGEDRRFAENTLLLLRGEILAKSLALLLKEYKGLFFKPNLIIQENEIFVIAEKEIAIQLIDVSLIDEENQKYIAEYFNSTICGQTLSYEILKLICAVDDKEIRRLLFLSMDFDRVQYYRISAVKQQEVKNGLGEAFDFSEVEEQILFMRSTKCSDGEFEKNIKSLISNKKFEPYEDEYVDYVNSLKRVTTETLSNICGLSTIPVVNPLVQEKLYSNKKYIQYVSAKTRYEKVFTFEEDKLDVLLPIYIKMYLSNKDSYLGSKLYMMENHIFVGHLMKLKKYEGTDEYNRKMFVNTLQTIESLTDLFENYDMDFCIEYLSEIRGFKDKETAEYFISKVKAETKLALSDEVYNNTYEKLLDGILKAKYTRYRNKASD